MAMNEDEFRDQLHGAMERHAEEVRREAELPPEERQALTMLRDADEFASWSAHFVEQGVAPEQVSRRMDMQDHVDELVGLVQRGWDLALDDIQSQLQGEKACAEDTLAVLARAEEAAHDALDHALALLTGEAD
ncbi:MAG: hypothetical protein ACRDMH_03370 [Solirubrobacterales bacterium]